MPTKPKPTEPVPKAHGGKGATCLNIPLDELIIRLKQGYTVVIENRWEFSPIGRDGSAHLVFHQSPPKVKRLKKKPGGEQKPPAGQA